LWSAALASTQKLAIAAMTRPVGDCCDRAGSGELGRAPACRESGRELRGGRSGPERVEVAHRDAPVRHSAGRIVRDHALERLARRDVLEGMHQRDPTLECRLELGAAAHRKRDCAEPFDGVTAFGGEPTLRPRNNEHCDDQILSMNTSRSRSCNEIPQP
jgi:hypothetical protein